MKPIGHRMAMWAGSWKASKDVKINHGVVMSSLRPFSQGPGPHRGQEGQAELKPLGRGTQHSKDRVIKDWRGTGRAELGRGCRAGLALEVPVTLRR